MGATAYVGRRLAIAAVVGGATLVPLGLELAWGQAPSSTSSTSMTTSTTTTTTEFTIPPTTPTPTTTPSFAPVQPLDLTFDPDSRVLSIPNPCPSSGDAQLTYDLFVVAGDGTRTRLATARTPFEGVPIGQVDRYEIPQSLPPGTYEVLLQCQAMPITIPHDRQQFAATIDVAGEPATHDEPPAAVAVPGTPNLTG